MIRGGRSAATDAFHDRARTPPRPRRGSTPTQRPPIIAARRFCRTHVVWGLGSIRPGQQRRASIPHRATALARPPLADDEGRRRCSLRECVCGASSSTARGAITAERGSFGGQGQPKLRSFCRWDWLAGSERRSNWVVVRWGRLRLGERGFPGNLYIWRARLLAFD